MTKSPISCRPARPFLLWILAASGGALLTVLALLLFYLSGGLAPVAPPVLLTSARLQLTSGQGAPTAAGLEIRQTDAQQLAVVQGSLRKIQANLYRRLSWHVSGLQPHHEIRLIWATLDDPGTTRERVLPFDSGEGSPLDLGAEPGWRGRISAIGLAVRGSLTQPLLVRSLELQPMPLTTGQLLRQMLEDWTAFEDWSQRSINYTAGAPLNALFPPTVTVALWVGFSAVLYALLRPPRRTPGELTPYAALFLIGWLALDLRWQWDLGQRLEQTAERFANKDETGRRLAALDGELYRFLLEVRQRLPKQPARVLIISSDPGGFLAGRARYHLLPHNGYAGLARLPDPGAVRADDYVLILTPLSEVRYDHGRRLLESAGVQLPAEMLYAAAAGTLFRVKEG
jgi:hypothetical protein